MKAFYLRPGVPAAGHVSGGYWHPGKIDGCRKCAPDSRLTQHGEARNPPKDEASRHAR